MIFLASQLPKLNLSVCEIVNDEVASELVCALPLKHAVNDIQIQLNTLKHAFERYRSEASIVLTDLISNQELLSSTAGNNRIDRFHLTSRRPYWCTKTMKWRPYWCTVRELALSYSNISYCFTTPLAPPIT
jgi:hypothetical protein